MERKLQEKLLSLQKTGHMIRFDVGPYVDGFAFLYTRDDGKIVFDSRVYSDFELDEVHRNLVYVYKQVQDWQD